MIKYWDAVEAARSILKILLFQLLDKRVNLLESVGLR